MYNIGRDHVTIDSSFFRRLLLNRGLSVVEINMLVQLFILGTLLTKVNIAPHFRDFKTNLS